MMMTIVINNNIFTTNFLAFQVTAEVWNE